MRMRHFIDLHKGITGLVVLAMIAIHGQWQNPTAWVYLALHGSYGLLWVLKSRWFADASWERPAGWAYGVVVVWGGLSLYWIAPWVLTQRGIEAPPWVLALCTFLYVMGLFFHFGADMQKHTALSIRPGLVMDGLWSICRNPNYFGELLIYLSFALLALHWAPIVVLALFVSVYWVPRMLQKDRSLSRYPEFAAWKQRTSLFIPFLL